MLIFVSGMADITDLMELLTAQLQSQRQQQQGGAGAGGGQGKLRGQPAVSAGEGFACLCCAEAFVLSRSGLSVEALPRPSTLPYCAR